MLDDMGNIAKWKESLAERTFLKQTINLMQLVYGKSTSMSTTSINKENSSVYEESDGEDFFKPKGEGHYKVCSRDYVHVSKSESNISF